MTATERLRQLLDEREMDWEAWNDRITVALPATHYLEITDGSLCVAIVDLTPEQAVEATLWRGTCKVVSKPCDMWECECGKAWWHGGAPNFCPHCGRRVIGADDE